MHLAVTLAGSVFTRTHATLLRVAARVRRFAALSLSEDARKDGSNSNDASNAVTSTSSAAVRTLTEGALAYMVRRNDGMVHVLSPLTVRLHVWVPQAMLTALSLPLRPLAGPPVYVTDDGDGMAASLAYYHITQLAITVDEAVVMWQRYAASPAMRAYDVQLPAVANNEDDNGDANAAAATTLPPQLQPRNTNGERFAPRVEVVMWRRAAAMLSRHLLQPTRAPAPNTYWATADEAAYVYQSPFAPSVLLVDDAAATAAATSTAAVPSSTCAVDVPHPLLAFPLRYYNVGASSRPHVFDATSCRRYTPYNYVGENYGAATALRLKRAAIVDGCLSQPRWLSVHMVDEMGSSVLPGATLVTMMSATMGAVQLVNVNMTSHPIMLSSYLRLLTTASQQQQQQKQQQQQPPSSSHSHATCATAPEDVTRDTAVSAHLLAHDVSTCYAVTAAASTVLPRTAAARVAPVTAVSLFALQRRRDVLSYNVYERSCRRGSRGTHSDSKGSNNDDEGDSSSGGSSTEVAQAMQRQCNVQERFVLADRATALCSEWAQQAARECADDVS